MDNQTSIRLVFFAVGLLLCGLWEFVSPRKPLTRNKWVRWANNLGLVGLNSLCLALMMPILAFGAAVYAEQYCIGVFNFFAVPLWLNLILSVILLDALIYFQHRVFHSVPFLWRLHRTHHADQDIDVTTGARFHPIEILLSMWIKVVAVFLLGVSPVAIVLFEIILNVSAMFNHSNAKLPYRYDQRLRQLIVTPDMHRIHHSVIEKETHSNFGFFLSVWDRWFASYQEAPEKGHQGMTIGLPYFRRRQEQHLWHMLTQPFRNGK